MSPLATVVSWLWMVVLAINISDGILAVPGRALIRDVLLLPVSAPSSPVTADGLTWPVLLHCGTRSNDFLVFDTAPAPCKILLIPPLVAGSLATVASTT
ncbi:Hypothetical protein NTJ_06548 [Nesidiocoris tenuis]|uniref:Secreted protein n=1 Tax=Nesidiocoris tenuis TaxID=355587 RepID=A0ABN7AQK9_9HEMI|nr:Hypothetical protein NTJ_06548 [Nesidiocoris tenuis]